MDTNFWSNILYVLFYTQEITLSAYNTRPAAASSEAQQRAA